MSSRSWLCATLMALMLMACVGETRYHHFLPLPAQGWSRQDTISFALPDSMQGDHLQMQVEVRAMRSYPYASLWVAVEQCDSLHRLMRIDTLCITMADSVGNLSGHGQNFLQYTSQALPLAHDSLGQCIQVRLRHLMTREMVPSLSDVGVLVSNP